MDLTPVPGVADPWSGDPRWVPGWTERGHPGYMGWAWYRLSVRVAVVPGERLGVNAPLQADDAYQLFANGTLVGSLGKFGSHGSVLATYFAIPKIFLLPPAPKPADGSAAAIRTLTFAYRIWMGPIGMTSGISPGGLHYAPLLVSTNSMDAQLRLDRAEWILLNIYPCFSGAAFLLLAVLAFSLILFDRTDPVYIWVGIALMVTVLQDVATAVSNYTEWLPSTIFFFLYDGVLNPLLIATWAMVWWVWFRLRRPSWMPRIIAAALLLNVITQWAARWYFAKYHPPVVWTPLQILNITVGASFVLLVVLILGLGIRYEGKEGWLAVPAVLALSFTLFPGALLEALGISFVLHPFGISFFLDYFAGLLLALAIGLLMLRRLRQSLERQRQMALDVKQAQEIQQIIVPQEHVSFAGFEIESEYRPAREVGGDFFQIIQNEADGRVLIVAGDVTGKGLKAGMLVALLVGAIRSLVDWTRDPAEILKALNQRLLGRGDARATCLALRIERDGKATLANAGHLPPYLNGAPVEIEGSLPLGILEDFECSTLEFQLSERDRLLLLSDGVPEATDQDGKLFGFERVLDLVRTSPSAASIAQAAQTFGQDDDISVIAVTRMATQQTLP